MVVLAFGAVIAIGLALRDAPADRSSDAASTESTDREPEVRAALEPVPSGHRARTDRGVAVKLYHVAATALSEADVRHAEREMAANFPGAIVTAPPTLAHNCHGWIFAGGRCWVSQDDVETILRDNGYREVADPRPGDVVIFRGTAGAIVHSGIVRATRGDRVEVESKWGYMHRVRHEVAAQPFGSQWAYFHTERATHLIHLAEPETWAGWNRAE
jgi:hypothetical protein